MSRRKPGDPIPGTEGKVSAAAIGAALGMQPGSEPKEAKPQELTPNQARLKMDDKYVGEAPDDGRVEYVVKAGRDALDLLCVNPDDLPVGTEAKLGPPQARAGSRPAAAADTQPDGAGTVEREREQLRADTREHARRQIERTKWAQAHGTAAQKKDAASEATATAALVKRARDTLGGTL